MYMYALSDFINLTKVHNFTVSAQDIFTFRRLSVFTVSFIFVGPSPRTFTVRSIYEVESLCF